MRFIATDLTKKAYLIACEAHFGQFDKGGSFFILHPMHIACQFNEEMLVAAAFLHDVIEDSELTENDLLSRGVPQDVVDIVSELTRKEGEKYFDYIERVSLNPNAAKIKLADLRHNSDLSRLPHVSDRDRGRQKRYFKAIEILTRGDLNGSI